MTLWTRDEAYEFLNERYHMDRMEEAEREGMIDDLCAMKHRPWCRTNLSAIAPSYGSECTCDGGLK